jgi:tetratricopeptide (TPR) repeat protein
MKTNRNILFRKPLFFLSISARRWFRALAALGAACVVFAALLLPSPWTVALLPLMGAAAASIFFLYASVTAQVPKQRCSFCLKPNTQVKVLVVSPRAGICEECAALTLENIAAHCEKTRNYLSLYSMLLDALPTTVPTVVSGALLKAVADETTSLDEKRRIASRCIDFFNNALAADLLFQIPEQEREAEDFINLGVALGRLGRLDEALHFTKSALNLDVDLHPLALNNAAWFQLQKDPEAAKEDLLRWIADIEQARHLLADLALDRQKFLLLHCLCTEAALRNALGDMDGAEAALNELKTLGPLKGRPLLIRGRMALKSGKPMSAALDFQRAIEDLHPESEDAKEAVMSLSRDNPNR